LQISPIPFDPIVSWLLSSFPYLFSFYLCLYLFFIIKSGTESGDVSFFFGFGMEDHPLPVPHPPSNDFGAGFGIPTLVFLGFSLFPSFYEEKLVWLVGGVFWGLGGGGVLGFFFCVSYGPSGKVRDVLRIPLFSPRTLLVDFLVSCRADSFFLASW